MAGFCSVCVVFRYSFDNIHIFAKAPIIRDHLRLVEDDEGVIYVVGNGAFTKLEQSYTKRA